MDSMYSVKPKASLLTADQVFGKRKFFFEFTSYTLELFEVKNHIYTMGSHCLPLFKKFSVLCATTDFADLLGAYLSESYYTVDFGLGERNSSSPWLILNPNGKGFSCVHTINYNGSMEAREYAVEDYGIRPILTFDTLPDFGSHIVSRKKGQLVVEYREYPQTKVDKELGETLTSLFEENKLPKTGKKFLGEYEEYEYNGRKFVRLRDAYYSRYPNYAKRYRTTEEYEKLRDEYHWVEVKPIRWFVDEETKTLISEKAIIGGLGISKDNNFVGSFEDSDIYKYLNGGFLRDLIPSVTLKEKEEERRKNLPKVEKLNEDIYSYLDYVPNRDEIIKQIEVIVNEYNGGLDKIKEAKKHKTLTIETIEGVSLKAEMALEEILAKVKKSNTKYKTYYEMLDLIDAYLRILDGEEVQIEEVDLDDDLQSIVSICLPFLHDNDREEIRNDLYRVLKDQKQEIKDYLDNKNEKIPYKTIDEMNLDLRKELHPVFLKLRDRVNKRDIQLEIMESLSNTMKGHFEAPRNETLAFFLGEINNVYEELNSCIDTVPEDMQEQYREQIKSIMEKQIDYDKDLLSIVKELREMLRDLTRILLEIQIYNEDIENIDKHRIDLDKIKRH